MFKSLWKQALGILIFAVLLIFLSFDFFYQKSNLQSAVVKAESIAIQKAQLRQSNRKKLIDNIASIDEAHLDELHGLNSPNNNAGISLKLYSALPYPKNKSRVLDSFQLDAWQKLNVNPKENLTDLVILDGEQHVRVVLAETFTEQICVDCHNNSALSPKTNWELGDVRGVLEYILPVIKTDPWLLNGINQFLITFIVIFIALFYWLFYLFNQKSKQNIDLALLPLKNQKFAMNAHSLVSMANIDGVITYVNDKFSEISGYSASELIGKKHSMLNSNNQPKAYWKKMHDTILSGNTWHDEVRNRAKDGHYYWVDTTIVPYFDSNNNVTGFTSIRTDITQQKENNNNLAIAKSQSEATRFAMDAHSLVSMADINGVITYVNDKFCEISGYSNNELIGQKHSKLNSNNKPKSYWKRMHETVLGGNIWHDEVRNRAKDGHHYWVDTTIVPNFDKNNEITGFTSIRTDITQQKENNNNLAIAKSQSEATRFAMDAHSLVSMADINGVITYVNDKFCEISGYSNNELIGQKHSKLNSNNKPKSYWKRMHETVLGGNIWHDEVRNRAKDGHHYWVDTTIVPNFDKNNEITGFTSIRTNITQQKENINNLAIAKSQAEATRFAMDAHSLVSMADINGVIIYVNEKFCEISGYCDEELIGKKHGMLNSNNKPKHYWKNMHDTVLAGNIWHDEVRNRAKDGHHYWVDTTIVPNFNSNNEVTGFTSIRTDITQQKENINDLAIAKEQAESAIISQGEAEEASDSKAEFLANMSHEIRTPMNGVIGMTNLLLESHLTKKQEKLANTVKSSAVSLLSIINDILDFSKVEAGKLDLELIPFNLGQMIEDFGVSMSFQAYNKNLAFICPATPIVQQWVQADPGRIRQVLTNLVGNAIKFTEKGEVAVYVYLESEDDEASTFRFEVKDTGIGISNDKQNLFDKFSQADTSTTRKYGGTGLGLSISKKLVELMGGEIGSKSTVNEGSTFWFTLPLTRTSSKNSAPLFNTDIKKEKVLIVDDNKTNLELMHQLHELWGIPHELADGAKTAMAKLEAASAKGAPFSIAILDMQMPESDGLDLCYKIQNSSIISKTKLILATSQAQRGDGSKMESAGFKGYITKPIQQSELFDMLLMISGLSHDNSTFVTRHTAKEQVQFKAHVLVVEDNATNQLVIEGVLRKLGITVDLAGNGEEAISALSSATEHDLVIMDCQMPVLDGYETTKKVRSDISGNLNASIPIIAMTANAMIGDKQKCLDVGMDDYLSKPIDIEQIIKKLQKWLPKSSSRTSDETGGMPLHSNNTIDSDPIFNYEVISTLLANNTELIETVAVSFYNDIDALLDTLSSSIKSKNAEQAASILHQIKGSSANIGAEKLMEIAQEMEQISKTGDLIELEKNINSLMHSVKLLKEKMKERIGF